MRSVVYFIVVMFLMFFALGLGAGQSAGRAAMVAGGFILCLFLLFVCFLLGFGLIALTYKAIQRVPDMTYKMVVWCRRRYTKSAV
jgi:hypothetical protein